MSEFDDLLSGDGVLMAGRFGPDGRIAEQKSRGLFVAYPPVLEMAQWFCLAATMMFNSMALAMDSIRRTGFDTTSWLPQRGWVYFGGDYSVAVHDDRFILAETKKIDSLDQLRRLLVEGTS
jgi:roadblock/LC7 domain-containing protein